MADNVSQLQQLLLRASSLENTLGLQTPVAKEHKVRKKAKKSVKLPKPVDKENVPMRIKPSRKFKHSLKIVDFSSEEEAELNEKSACSSCENNTSTNKIPGSSMSIAYSMAHTVSNVNISKQSDLSSICQSETEHVKMLQQNDTDVDYVPESQDINSPSHISSSSLNISDLVSNSSKEPKLNVIPDSQKNDFYCHPKMSVVPDSQSIADMSAMMDSLSVHNEDNRNSSHSMHKSKLDSSQISSASNGAKLDESVMLLSRLDKILESAEPKCGKKFASQSKKRISSHAKTESVISEENKEVDLNSVHDQNHTRYVSCSGSSTFDSSSSSYHSMLTNSTSSEKLCSKTQKTKTKRAGRKINKKSNLLSVVEFSSEEENVGQTEKIKPDKNIKNSCSSDKATIKINVEKNEIQTTDSFVCKPKSEVNNIATKELTNKRQPVKKGKKTKSLIKSIPFSDDDDDDEISQDSRISTEGSMNQDSNDSNISTSLHNEDTNILLLRQRFDNLLSSKKMKSSKRPKQNSCSKNSSNNLALSNIFSSEEDETEKSSAKKCFDGCKVIEDNGDVESSPETCNISLQVSLCTEPEDNKNDTNTDFNMENIEPIDHCSPSPESDPNLSLMKSPDVRNRNLHSNIGCDSLIADTTNKSLQVSFSSPTSVADCSTTNEHEDSKLTKNSFLSQSIESRVVSNVDSPSVDFLQMASPELNSASFQVSSASPGNIFENINKIASDQSEFKSESPGEVSSPHPKTCSVSMQVSFASPENVNHSFREVLVVDSEDEHSNVSKENTLNSDMSSPVPDMYKTAVDTVLESPEAAYTTVAEFGSFEVGSNTSIPTAIKPDLSCSSKEIHTPVSPVMEQSPGVEQLDISSDDENTENTNSDSDSDYEPSFGRSVRPKVKQGNARPKNYMADLLSSSSDSDQSFDDLTNKTSDESSNSPVSSERKRKIRLKLKRQVEHVEELSDNELPDLNNSHRALKPVISDSSDDENLESFFQNQKEPQKKKTTQNDLDDFVVSDDDVSSGLSETEDSIFYIKTNRTMNTPKGRTRESPVVVIPDFSDSSSEDEADPVFKTPIAPPVKPKSLTCRPPVTRRPLDDQYTPLKKASILTPHRPNSTGHESKRCGFLKSLSQDIDDGVRHPDAFKYLKNFKKLKEELTLKLLKLYNDTVFNSKLPADFPVEWNTRLYKTAGYCTYKKTKSDDELRSAKVELSVKVCDSAERVRDTLIHELCHAAVWLFNGKTDGHGHHWKNWARKASLMHPDLPVISRCHTYKIQTKYTYKCSKCGYEIGRHSKSLDTEKKVCGHCMSPFQLIVNSKSGAKSVSQTPKTPNRFALFVKENYGSVKKQGQLSHKDVMQKLSFDFALQNKIS